MFYAQIDDSAICIAVSDLSGTVSDSHMIPIGSYDTSLLGKKRVGSAWQTVAPAPVVPPVYEWYIDVGPFFDRFGAAKMAILTSTNPIVQALRSDLQVRHWVDLQRPDVAQGIQAMIDIGVTGLTPALKASVLTTPVTREEQLALRKQFFS